MDWLVDNVGAAIVGVIVGAVLASSAAALKRRQSDRARRDLERDSGPNHERVARFYHAIGQRDELYRPTHIKVRQLPLLVHPTMLFDIDVRDTDGVITLQSKRLDDLPVDQRVIRRRQSSGTELWNGDLVYVANATLGATMPNIGLRRSSYFAYVTAVDRVLKSLWGRRPERSPILERYRSVAEVFDAEQPSLWISGAAVTVFSGEDDRPQVIIHRRSSRVVNAPGVRTVAPVFGCDAAMIGNNSSTLGLPLYNVAREYGEELFDKEDVIRASVDNWYHPDQAIERVEEIQALLDDQAQGSVRIRLLGMCVNVKDCDLSLAYLIDVGPMAVSQVHLRQMRAGWEAEADAQGSPAIEVLDLFDPVLDEWSASGELYPTSVFALDRARSVVMARGPW